MKRFILSFAVIAASLGLAAGAEASTATSTLNVSFNAITSCTVTTTPVDFGSGTGLTGASANGDVTVNCSSGVPYIITLDAGLHYDGVTRFISDGANSRPYYLYPSNIALWEWGDYGYANTVADGFKIGLGDTGSGVAQAHTVYGILQGDVATLPAGAYSDTVTVTVYY